MSRPPGEKDTWAPDESTALRPDDLVNAPVGVDRYVVGELLGTGAMGEVYRVRDRQLNRNLAMKVARKDRKLPPAMLARFVEEAQATAQLQHPGIVPVIEIGMSDDDRPWFTMREITGETLRAALERAGAHLDGAPTIRQLIDALHQASEAVAYAHDRGVIHRDLKPENILLGAFGEVWVVDWGLAKVLGTDEAEPTGALPVETARTTDSTFSTRHGQVAGTPRYMAPEQWAGRIDAFGPATDVYALGGILCEILTGEPKPDPKRPCAVPELVEMVERALGDGPEGRQPDASAFAEELRQWLDGEARTEEALHLVADARISGQTIAGLTSELTGLRGETEALREQLAPLADLEQKRRLWALEDRIAQLEGVRALKEVEHVQLLRAALIRAPDLVEAREGLADHYQVLHAEAERRRDRPAAIRYEALLRSYDTGRWDGWLAGNGSLSLATDPPGAEADLLRWVERDRRLIPEFDRFLGRTPVVDADVPHGSYLVRLRHSDRPEVLVPVRLDRQATWTNTPPGASEPAPVPLPEALDPDEVYVPAGWAISGGDGDAIGPLPRRRAWVDGFAIRRFAVTMGEYAAFLGELGSDEQERRAGEGWARTPEGWRWGGHDDLRLPAFDLSWFDAMAYAEWFAAKTGKPWRLATEVEWEKAARGVDERLYPWGDHLDATFVGYMASHGEEGPRPLPVDAFEADRSPYGVRGMAGTSSDWVLDPYHRNGVPAVEGRVPMDAGPVDTNTARVQRGGTWGLAERRVRLPTRWWQDPRARHNMCGTRLVRSWP